MKKVYKNSKLTLNIADNKDKEIGIVGGIFMKIDVNSVINIQKVNKAYGKNVAKTQKTSGVQLPSDKIEISSEARDVQVAMNAIKDVPDERTELVNKLKAQIKDGTYNPSAEDVAEKMLASINRNKV